MSEPKTNWDPESAAQNVRDRISGFIEYLMQNTFEKTGLKFKIDVDVKISVIE